MPRGLRGQGPAVLRENRLDLAGLEEEQGVVVVGKLGEREADARLLGEPTRLPHLELAEVARDDPACGLAVGRAVRRLLPIPPSLIFGLRERRQGFLHLDDEDPRPVEVHEARGGREVFELSPDRVPISSVRLEKVVEERLRLGALGAGVSLPLLHEHAEGRLDLASAAHPSP